jgi:hypothetical protein
MKISDILVAANMYCCPACSKTFLQGKLEKLPPDEQCRLRCKDENHSFSLKLNSVYRGFPEYIVRFARTQRYDDIFCSFLYHPDNFYTMYSGTGGVIPINCSYSFVSSFKTKQIQSKIDENILQIIISSSKENFQDIDYIEKVILMYSMLR